MQMWQEGAQSRCSCDRGEPWDLTSGFWKKCDLFSSRMPSWSINMSFIVLYFSAACPAVNIMLQPMLLLRP